jgi:tRNA U34 5-carboxymethylaminomethyl modifying GTPase MnmE/TrmE
MLNEKQEKFCQAYVLHRNATEAARAAGYAAASANNQGYRLLQSDEVTERIYELEQELETNVDVIEEIESQYTYAKTNGHTNSAIKALELLSRIRGANSDININMDEETLETAIVGCLNVLGEEKVYDLLSKCDFTEDEENGGPENVTEGSSLESLDIPLPEEADSSV